MIAFDDREADITGAAFECDPHDGKAGDCVGRPSTRRRLLLLKKCIFSSLLLIKEPRCIWRNRFEWFPIDGRQLIKISLSRLAPPVNREEKKEERARKGKTQLTLIHHKIFLPRGALCSSLNGKRLITYIYCDSALD